MKISLSRQLFILCIFAAAMLSSFQLGVGFGTRPYLTWFHTNREATALASGVEFTRIAVEQSRILLSLSYVACGVSCLGFGLALFQYFRRKDPVHLPGPARGLASDRGSS